MAWHEDTEWERLWWGNCANTLREEFLQFSYAKRMGLETFYDGRSVYNIDMKGKSVLDIGGGPVSLLLKCVNVTGVVVDPCQYPEWVSGRYSSARIKYIQQCAEDLLDYAPPPKFFDEAWIYNVLQHTISPQRIIHNAKQLSKKIRIFEWINAGVGPGHPHELTEEKLNEWLNGKGIVEKIDEHGAIGRCYYGSFE